jgi:DNA-binding NtrC family response regulator
MQALFEYLRVIRDSESTVLITGESGTGKEVTARLLHESSRRKHHPFLAVSCALFSDTLIESELFGHERGAFTGAVRDRPGRFELADGGTLFLDDMDDVPLSMQVKLLRVLQNRTVERLGGTRTVPVNVRIIAGTKHELKAMVSAATFREDLYYRLNVLPIDLPPLRERCEDIPLLMDHFLKLYFRRRGDDVPPVSEGVKQAFMRYAWPGNVRELENACERIAQTCTCGAIRVGCVAASVLLRAGLAPPEIAAPLTDPHPDPQGPAALSLDDRLHHLEASLIREALMASGGNRSRAAELLQIKRSTLGDRIKRCGLDEPNTGEGSRMSSLEQARPHEHIRLSRGTASPWHQRGSIAH